MLILLAGYTGRLGSEILKILKHKLETEPKSPHLSFAIHCLSKHDIADPVKLQHVITQASVIIDVTLADGTRALVNSLSQIPDSTCSFIKGVIIGTTGHTPKDVDTIHRLAKTLPVCRVSNFSKGINLFQELLKATTPSGKPVYQLMQDLGFDMALHETHHTHKKDAPSGTALTLASAGHIPKEKISASRVGQVVGEHTVWACAEAEEIRITHLSHSRSIYAVGAVDLAFKMFAKNSTQINPAGLYTIGDFL